MEHKGKVAIMQPYLFPYIGYFQLMHAADTFVVYDDVNFINRGWINRNNILLGGKAHLFTVPLIQASQNKLINEIEVAEAQSWKPKLLKTIEAAYKKAPQYGTIFPMLDAWLGEANETIAQLNLRTLQGICAYVGIPTNIIGSSSVYHNRELKGQYRILDICLREKAHTYINPIGGKELYDRNLFAENRIDLFFIRSQISPYTQGAHEFVPNLSMLDYLMYLSPEAIRTKLNEFNLETN